MAELRTSVPERVEKENVLEGVGQVVLAPDHVSDGELPVVYRRREMVCRLAVAAKKGEVLNVPVAPELLAENQILERHSPRQIARYAEADDERLPAGRAGLTLGCAQLAHPGVEEPRCPLAAGGRAPVVPREVAVGGAAGQERFAGANVTLSTPGLEVLFVPREIEPPESVKN